MFDEAALLLRGGGDIPERIEPGSVLLYPPLAVEDVLSDAFQHPVEGQGVVVGDPPVVPSDRSQIVEVRTAFKLLPDHGHWESLVVDDEASFYAAVADESPVGGGVDAVSGEHLRAYRLHPLDVVGIDDGYVFASLRPSLVGELGKVVDGARAPLQRPVDRDVVVLHDGSKASLIEFPSFPSVLTDPVEERADAVLGKGAAGIEHPRERPVIVRLHPGAGDTGPYRPQAGHGNDAVGVVCRIDMEEIAEDVTAQGMEQGRGTVGKHVGAFFRRLLFDGDVFSVDDVPDHASVPRKGVASPVAGAVPASHGVAEHTRASAVFDDGVDGSLHLPYLLRNSHRQALLIYSTIISY